jgi:hypothetical protein
VFAELIRITIVAGQSFQHDTRGMLFVWPVIIVAVSVVVLALIMRSRKQRRELRSLGIRKEGLVGETYMGKTVKLPWTDIERVDFHRGKGARIELLASGKYFRLSSVFPGFSEVREALSEACRENYVETKVIDHGGKEKQPWFVTAPKRALEKQAAKKREETQDGRLEYIRFVKAVKKAQKGEEPGEELIPVPETLRDEIRKSPKNRGPVLLVTLFSILPTVILIGLAANRPWAFPVAAVGGGGLFLIAILCTSAKKVVRRIEIDQQGFTAETFGGEGQHISWKNITRVDILLPQGQMSGGIIVEARDGKIMIGSYFPKFGTMVEMVLQECAKRRIMFYYSKWHLPGQQIEPDWT